MSRGAGRQSTVEFDEGREVVRKTDGVAVGQMMFQCELIGGCVNLAEIVDANICWADFISLQKVWNDCQSNKYQKATHNEKHDKKFLPKTIGQF